MNLQYQSFPESYQKAQNTNAQTNDNSQYFIDVNYTASQPQNQIVQPLQIEKQPTLTNMNDSQSKFIKNLDFNEQKWYFVKIILLMILWTFIYAMIVLITIYKFNKQPEKFRGTFTILLIPSFIVSIYLLRKGSLKSRNCTLNYIFLFSRSPSHHIDDFFRLTNIWRTKYLQQQDILKLTKSLISYYLFALIFAIQLFNLSVTVIALLYLLVEQKQLQSFKMIIFELVIICPLFLLGGWFIMVIVVFQIIVYSCLIVNVLKQIQNGRFNLQQNQVIAGALAANFGIYIPCQPED